MSATGRRCPDAKAENKSRWPHDNPDERVFQEAVLFRSSTKIGSQSPFRDTWETFAWTEFDFRATQPFRSSSNIAS